MAWLSGVLESLAVGAAGGLVAYWLANRRFVSQRWWDRRLALCAETVDNLNLLEHSLAGLHSLLAADGPPDGTDSPLQRIKEYEDLLFDLYKLKTQHLLLASERERLRLELLYVLLSTLDFTGMSHSDSEEKTDLLRMIRRCKNELSGIAGEIALNARLELGVDSRWLARLSHLLPKKRKPGTTDGT